MLWAFVNKAKGLDFDDIELDTKRPHHDVLDLDRPAPKETQEDSKKVGLDIP